MRAYTQLWKDLTNITLIAYRVTKDRVQRRLYDCTTVRLSFSLYSLLSATENLLISVLLFNKYKYKTVFKTDHISVVFTDSYFKGNLIFLKHINFVCLRSSCNLQYATFVNNVTRLMGTLQIFKHDIEQENTRIYAIASTGGDISIVLMLSWVFRNSVSSIFKFGFLTCKQRRF